MESIPGILLTIIYSLIPVLFILFCARVIKVRFFDKRWSDTPSQMVTHGMLPDFQTQDRREAIAEIRYQEEDHREEDRGGDALRPPFKIRPLDYPIEIIGLSKTPRRKPRS
jgi:hypothetical protein